MEKFPETSKEQEASHENIGARFLSKELDRLPDTRRAGGFLLMTLAAMGLAMAGAGKAEAQVKIGGYTPIGTRGGIVGEVIRGGRHGVGEAIERKKMKAREKIDKEFQAKLQRLAEEQNKVEKAFKEEKISLEQFEMAKQHLEREKDRLNREYDRKSMNPLGVKGSILEGAIKVGVGY